MLAPCNFKAKWGLGDVNSFLIFKNCFILSSDSVYKDTFSHVQVENNTTKAKTEKLDSELLTALIQEFGSFPRK